MTPTIDPRAVDAMNRLLDHLPQGNDLALVVLKGHLLIEERLTDLVEKRMSADPSSLRSARLQFAQLLEVAKGFLYTPDREWLWAGIGRLNALRNDLVHHLESDKVEAIVKEIVAALKPAVDLAPPPPANVTDNLAGRLRAAIALMYGSLVTYDWS